MPERGKTSWHDLVVYDAAGERLGPVKDILVLHSERGRQWLFDCLLDLKTGADREGGPSFAVPGAKRGPTQGAATQGHQLRNLVDWEGFDWSLSTRVMELSATELVRQCGGDPRAARALFQALLALAEAYQSARSSVYAEMRQIAYRIYVPRADVLADDAGAWNGARVAADLSARGKARFPRGIEGLLRLHGDKDEPIFVHGEQLLEGEVLGLARLAGSDLDEDGALTW
jgi:hypothetical protein